MADAPRQRLDSRSLLLSVALASIPIAGCDTALYTGEQQAAYREVVVSKDPALASEFILRYPGSPLVRDVLVGLPPDALKRVSKDATNAISPKVLVTLPPDILAQLGLTVPAQVAAARDRATRGGYDG